MYIHIYIYIYSLAPGGREQVAGILREYMYADGALKRWTRRCVGVCRDIDGRWLEMDDRYIYVGGGLIESSS